MWRFQIDFYLISMMPLSFLKIIAWISSLFFCCWAVLHAREIKQNEPMIAPNIFPGSIQVILFRVEIQRLESHWIGEKILEFREAEVVRICSKAQNQHKSHVKSLDEWWMCVPGLIFSMCREINRPKNSKSLQISNSLVPITWNVEFSLYRTLHKVLKGLHRSKVKRLN